jgi:hypothetical protein
VYQPDCSSISLTQDVDPEVLMEMFGAAVVLVLDAVLVVDARLVAVAVDAVVGEDTVTLREAES